MFESKEIAATFFKESSKREEEPNSNVNSMRSKKKT
jgi:hypothetical protein